jgi:hypothetical protein
METKHTPEPWRHEADDGALAEYIYAGDMLIAELSWTYFNGPSGETQFANAELIAAAPETAAERDLYKDALVSIYIDIRNGHGYEHILEKIDKVFSARKVE